MMDCKFLVIEDATSYHGDVFDHPDYEYTCEKCRQEVIPFLHCNEERCKNYTKKSEWNRNFLVWKVKYLSMKHLVIFYTENGIYSAVYDFKNIPQTIEDIKEMQKDIQKKESLIQMPVIVNWLPISN